MTLKWIFAPILFLLSFSGLAQANLKEVPGLPTKELYDLHVDRRGYLWIAHDLGISRYDGLNYLHFSSPVQASLSVSGITEDNEGRIWCHNFSGQIFYIEKGQMNLLDSYDYTKEKKFPRIVVCGDELLATTDRGLFVCSTVDLKSKYLPVATLEKPAFTSISVVGKKAILFDNRNWYSYSAADGIKTVIADTSIKRYPSKTAMMQAGSFGNLLFLVWNTDGIVQKLLFRNDSLKLVSSYSSKDFINAVSINEQSWIHARSQSKTLDGKWTIGGQNLTDAVIDQEGNTWFSSLKKGLLVSYKKAQWGVMMPTLEESDFIRCLNVKDGYFFAGTDKGYLLLLDRDLKKIKWKQRLMNSVGAIEYIRFYKDHQFIVGNSLDTYIVNPLEGRMEQLPAPASIKDVDFDESSIYLASSNGLCMVTLPDPAGRGLQQLEKGKFPFAKEISERGRLALLVEGRARAIRYDKETGDLYASLKNGLHQVNRQGSKPFKINGSPVFASSLWYTTPRLFISTFNDGLWIKNGTKLTHFTTADFLASNTILRTKATSNHLWLFQNETIQLLNLRTEKLATNLELPKVNGDNVFDVAEWNGFAYLTTEEGIYKVPMDNVVNDQAPGGFLEAVIVNDRDTLYGDHANMDYQDNNLQFVLSSPSYYDHTTTSFRYRMRGISNEWQNTKAGERIIRYVSIPPGQYIFEAFAINKKGLVQKQKILFGVFISKPWWRKWWFFVLLFAALTAIIYLFEQNRLRQMMKVETVRRSISSDLHDDIGATLSSINIYTELAKKEKDNDLYLASIQKHSQEVTGKLDDLIWSINPRNDSFGKLIGRMHDYAVPVLKAKGIQCNFDYNESLLKEKLHVQVKQNLYLIVKELVNNVVKHSKAKNCFISLDCRDHLFVLTVKDDGAGYDPDEQRLSGNGITNVRERVAKIRGEMKIQSGAGMGTAITVTRPLPRNYFSVFEDLINKIRS